MTRLRPGDQPLPTPNGHPSIHDQVIHDLLRTGHPGLAGVADALAARRALGLTRYGSLLQPFNGRDCLRDLLDELLDAIVYARQVVLEGGVADVNEFENIEALLTGIAARVRATPNYSSS